MGGVYIHIPFCFSKCPYCDFYSFFADEKEKREYVSALIDEIKTNKRAAEYVRSFKADTLYLGGGTPSVLDGELIYEIISTAKKKYSVPENGEITVECNPHCDIESLIPFFKISGVNRISLGLQSAVEKERKVLGRISDRKRITEVIDLLKSNGINNISLDVMMGVPYQTAESLKETLDFCISSGVTHISSYILKLEEGTFFYKNQSKYPFPDEDAVCDMYKFCCDYLEKHGFSHYEISNFAKSGYESRHNTKYWKSEEYLGIGAAAHSFVDGKRFFYGRSCDDFINGKPPVFDGCGGDCEEYIMLGLRLKEGISVSELIKKFGEKPAESIIIKAPLFKKRGLVNYDGDKLSLTVEGCLLSNSIIAQLIE